MSRSKYRPRNRFVGYLERPRHDVTVREFETWYERRPWQEFSTEHTGELIETDHRYYRRKRNPAAREKYLEECYARLLEQLTFRLNTKHNSYSS